MKQFADAPVFSVADVLRESPGVSLKQGNGPRDMGISIRGSNARNGFGVRNIVILEEVFPSRSRTDCRAATLSTRTPIAALMCGGSHRRRCSETIRR